MAYVAQADLEALITPEVVLEIYDDQNVGYVNVTNLAQDIALACSLTDAKIARVYPGPFPIVQKFATWAAVTTYATDASVVPSVATGYAYQCGQGGNSGATPPVFPTAIGSTVTDGQLTWTTIPLTPQMIRMSALWFLKALAWQRDPERVRQDGERWMNIAEKFAEDLCEAKSFITDLLASPQPSNVGGLIINNGPRMLVDNNDLSDNLGDF